MSKRVSIGLDVGGTKIAGGLMDEHGVMLKRLTVRTEASQGGAAILDRLLGVVEQLLDQATATGHQVIGVGVASPGVVEIASGTVLFASNNLPGWSGTPVGETIRERFDLPAWADNDGNVALVGELQFGAGRGEKNALMITLGTGVGGSVAVGGRILRGVHGVAGKFGHIPVSRGGPVCSCGRQGCIEAYVSGPSLVRTAAARLGFAGTAEDLLALASAGDRGGRSPSSRARALGLTAQLDGSSART